MSNRDNNTPDKNGPQPEKKFSITEATAVLEICERSIYQNRMDGTLPFSQKGKKGQVFFIWADFETYWKNIKKQ